MSRWMTLPRGGRRRRVGERRLKLEAAVRPRLVVVADVLGEDGLEMSSGHDEEVVEAVHPHPSRPVLAGKPRPGKLRMDG
jgi:hypothetical protein